MPTDSPKALIFILGGARSGKSSLAQRLATGHDPVLFTATAEAGDDDMRARIARHREERPAAWRTLEEPLRLATALEREARDARMVVVDCLTLWIGNLMLQGEESAESDAAILDEVEKLLQVYEAGTASWIVVSNEVGLGIVPATSLGRHYRDLLGKVNQRIAARATRALFVVAGLALDLAQLAAIPPHQDQAGR